jgi:hypothetical protein
MSLQAIQVRSHVDWGWYQIRHDEQHILRALMVHAIGPSHLFQSMRLQVCASAQYEKAVKWKLWIEAPQLEQGSELDGQHLSGAQTSDATQ